MSLTSSSSARRCCLAALLASCWLLVAAVILVAVLFGGAGLPKRAVIAHRGLGFGLPENTPEAVDAAYARGYRSEIDVYNIGGQWFVFHDDEIDQNGCSGETSRLTDPAGCGLLSFCDFVDRLAAPPRAIDFIHVKNAPLTDDLRCAANQSTIWHDFTIEVNAHSVEMAQRYDLKIALNAKTYRLDADMEVARTLLRPGDIVAFGVWDFLLHPGTVKELAGLGLAADVYTPLEFPALGMLLFAGSQPSYVETSKPVELTANAWCGWWCVVGRSVGAVLVLVLVGACGAKTMMMLLGRPRLGGTDRHEEQKEDFT